MCVGSKGTGTGSARQTLRAGRATSAPTAGRPPRRRSPHGPTLTVRVRTPPHTPHYKGGSLAPLPFFASHRPNPLPLLPFLRARRASGLHLPASKGRKARTPLPNWEHWEGSGRLLSTGSLPLKSPFGPRHPSNAPSDVTGSPETGSDSGLADQKIGVENK